MAMITLAEAARRLGRSRQRVAQFVAAGRLRSTRDQITGWHLLDERDVARFAATPRRPGRKKAGSRVDKTGKSAMVCST